MGNVLYKTEEGMQEEQHLQKNGEAHYINVQNGFCIITYVYFSMNLLLCHRYCGDE